MKHLPTYPYFLILCLLYFLLPTANANIDSWYYAACVKHGQQLLNPHHLFYNYFGLAFYRPMHAIYNNFEAINALFVMNALAASFTLYYFYKLLLALGQTKEVAMALTLFCGSCFGFFRFATDAETYILPLCFSTVSTYIYLGSQSKLKYLWMAVFSALAVLTHQLHIWWALALLIHVLMNKSIRWSSKITVLTVYSAIPIIYYIAYLSAQSLYPTFTAFYTGEYSRGNAGIDVSPLAVLLTLINAFRSVFQMHGDILLLIDRFPFVFALVFSSMLYVIFHFHKKNRLKLHMKLKPKRSFQSGLFILAFLLHILFAMVSSGNAEFMVMLPFLGVAFFASRFDFNSLRPALPLTICLLIWNLSMGILPNRFLDFNGTEMQEQYTLQNPHEYFYWQNKPLVENRLCYKLGFNKTYKLVSRDSLSECLDRGVNIYSDIGNSKGKLGRHSFYPSGDARIIEPYQKQAIDSFQNFYGKNYILLISKP